MNRIFLCLHSDYLTKSLIDGLNKFVSNSFDFSSSNSNSNKKEIPRILSINGDTATIKIHGLLTPKRINDSWWADAPDHTVYGDISESIEIANNDLSVKKITLDINSPGGFVTGVDAAGLSIKNSKKSVVANVSGMALSGGYWLASQAKKINATSRTAEFGSIGVIVQGYDYSGALKQMGIEEHVIRSTDAPDKAPSVDNKKERNLIKSNLDDIHQVFADRVSTGRSVSIENINNNFGRGGVLLASDALKVGMIDNLNEKVAASQNTNKELTVKGSKTPALSAKKNNGGSIVNRDQLISENPDLYNQILQEGRENGVKSEKERMTKLNAYKGINSKCDGIVNDAIAAGKNINDVMAEIFKAQAAGNSSTADAVIDSEDSDNTSSVSGDQDAAGNEVKTEEQKKIDEKKSVSDMVALATNNRSA